MNAAEKQQMPSGKGKDICSLVKSDLEQRMVVGEKKYGQRLLPNNGRNSLLDAYQEALDLCMYLRQKIEEEETAQKECATPTSSRHIKKPDKDQLCEGMPHGSCKGETMCDPDSPCFRPVKTR